MDPRDESWHWGIHAVETLLRDRPQAISRVLASRDKSPRVGPLLKLARKAGISVRYLGRDQLDRELRHTAGRRVQHQGIAAQVSSFEYTDLGDFVDRCREPGRKCVVMVDRVVDTGNLGAMLRSCAAAGVSGVILSAKETAGIDGGVARASAGTLGRFPISRSERPSKTLEALKGLGFRACALDTRGSSRWDQVELGERIVLVAGGEERGIRAGILDKCDVQVVLPMADGVESLNVSVATGILLFEWVRQGSNATLNS